MKVSVVVAAFNESASIGPLLDALCGDESKPHSLVEILVYDDGSTDDTCAIVEDRSRRTQPVRLVRGGERRGRAAACNELFSMARGEAVVKFDADVLPRAGAVRALCDAIAAGASMAFGICEPVRRRINPVSAGAAFAAALVQELQLGSRAAEFAVGRIIALDRAASSIRIPPDVTNEDHYLSLKVRESGGTVALARGAACRFIVPDRLADYRRQSSRIRHGERQLERDHGLRPMRGSELAAAISACARRDPAGAVWWAAIYASALFARSHEAPSEEATITSTKGALG